VCVCPVLDFPSSAVCNPDILDIANVGISAATKALNVAAPALPFGAANTVFAVLDLEEL
jgi:hypothetical protein